MKVFFYNTQAIAIYHKKRQRKLRFLYMPRLYHFLNECKFLIQQSQIHEDKRVMVWIIKVSNGDQGQQTESNAGLLATLKRWGNKCVNPEYDRVRAKLKQ